MIYYIQRSNKTRSFNEVASDIRNASVVVVRSGEQTGQMKVEIELLMRMKDIHIYWRPSENGLEKLETEQEPWKYYLDNA